LASRTGVISVQDVAPLEYLGDMNLQLTRADPPPIDAAGTPFTGRGITVAVLDSGIDATHPDLAGRVKANVKLSGGAFSDSVGDSNGHGTHVAGIVAASGATTQGRVRGVAPDASLVGIDISDHFTTASALLAYDWLFVHKDDYGIRVVVNAWGRVGEGKTFDPDDAEIRAIDRLVDSGVVVLFSASNHGPGPSTLSLEAMDPRVITVGAVDAAAQTVSYSSRGPVISTSDSSWIKPDVVAPGDTILGLRSQEATPDANSDHDAFHRYYSGTSQAVPHVAGIVALMLEANAAMRPSAVQNAIRESAIDVGPPGLDDATGFGLVDARDAVHRALGELPDRGNVLVAGGADTFTDHEQLPAGQAPSGLLGFLSAPTAGWSTTFAVKPDASVATFDVVWSAPVGAVTVTLEKDGLVKGTWTQPSADAGKALVRGRLDAPGTGIWTLRATGGAPTPVDVTSSVAVTLNANPDRAVDLDSRYRLPDTPAGATAALAHGEAASALVQTKLFLHAHPAVPPTLLAGFLFGAGLLWRPRVKRIHREVVLQEIDGDA
ncbi:MAG: S8 family serine peptidase, partial [Candidatus Thermoplasmatota archaeon]